MYVIFPAWIIPDVSSEEFAVSVMSCQMTGGDVIRGPSQPLFPFHSTLRFCRIVFKLGLLWTWEIQCFSTAE